jgi:acyl carrier protein
MSAPSQAVQELVARQLGRHHVSLDDRLVEDLGAESIDLVTIAAVVEESFGVSVAEERLPLLHTVRDLAAEIARLRGTG